ncbi:MAG: MarR family transcriptional regulator [Burkholderiaceae bacterium]|nr:MarR family transcriptional regulator [Burkholderiaceae bacterium]
MTLNSPEQANSESTKSEENRVAHAFYSAETYIPEAGIGYLMRRVLHAIGQEMERQLEPSGLTNAQWVPLFKLLMGHASTVAGLACECHLDAGAMTRLLDRLEAKGLCRRVRSLEDRRVVNIELTDAGRDAAKEIPAALSRVHNAHMAGFSVEEFETLKGFLHRILDNAQSPSNAGARPAPKGTHEA